MLFRRKRPQLPSECTLPLQRSSLPRGRSTGLLGSPARRQAEDRSVNFYPALSRNRMLNDYWHPFLGGQGSAPTYAMSLDPRRREQLRDLIQTRLPIHSNGSIHLVARAWAVKGTRT